MCPLLDIPTVSAMSVSFNLHSPNIRTFWMISSVVASFGLPEVQSDRDDYNVQNNSVGDKPCKKHNSNFVLPFLKNNNLLSTNETKTLELTDRLSQNSKVVDVKLAQKASSSCSLSHFSSTPEHMTFSNILHQFLA